eukprot:13923474-Ditylum_brightwellii.AAC.1
MQPTPPASLHSTSQEKKTSWRTYPHDRSNKEKLLCKFTPPFMLQHILSSGTGHLLEGAQTPAKADLTCDCVLAWQSIDN